MQSNNQFNCLGIKDNSERSRCRRESATKLGKDWLNRLAFGPDQDIAELIQLWLSIFAVNWRTLPNPYWLNQQIQTIERCQFKTYPELLAALLEDPAIIHSLNGFSNHRRNPNENLARELLELYSLGEGAYSEVDVQQTALALTGYRLNDENQVFISPRRHATGTQVILGKQADFDARSLAMWLGKQPSLATHITHRVWNRWIGVGPSSNNLKEMAKQWVQNNLSLPWLYSNLSKHPEAKRCSELGLRLLDPIHLIARSLKLIGSRHPNALDIALSIQSSMGQPSFQPPTVKGWPYGEGWLLSRLITPRKNALLRLLGDEEVWDSRSLPTQLDASLVPFPPLNLSLPAVPTRENIGLLFSDPSWQFARSMISKKQNIPSR